MKSKVLAFLVRFCLNKLTSLAHKQLYKYACRNHPNDTTFCGDKDRSMIVDLSIHEASLKSLDKSIKTLSSPELLIEIYVKNVGLYINRKSLSNNFIKEEKTTN
nr:putative ORF1 [Marmot picobirnavirus]